ncbi:MAG: serine protease inhibitor 3/4 [Verrucomicrobiota bacterium]|jgi:serpin B
MNRRQFAFAFSAALISASWESGGKTSASPPAFGAGLTDFSVDLLREQLKQPGNVLSGCFGVYENLALSSLGAQGPGLAALQKQLGLPEAAALQKELAAFHAGLAKKSNCALASSLWIDQRYARFRDDFLKQVRDSGAAVEAIDYAQAKAAAATLNHWASTQTRKQIAELVKAEDFASKSRPGLIVEPALTLLSASWFKDQWRSRFDKALSSPQDFRGSEVRKVTMMRQTASLRYAADAHFEMLEMPMADQDFAFLFLLPRPNRSLPESLASFQAEAFSSLQDRLLRSTVNLALPRFKLRQQTDLLGLLKPGPLKPVFGTDTFTPMIVPKTEAMTLAIDTFAEEAMIEVNEDGAEAAAVTKQVHYSIGCAALPPTRTIDFVCDRPFLFFIVHQPTRLPLFARALQEAPEAESSPVKN